MCKHGTLEPVTVIRRANPFVDDGAHVIHVDSCIADEIQRLNHNGIITEQCCCGHGKSKPNCLISLESKERAEELGYRVSEYNKEQTKNGRLEIKLTKVTERDIESARILRSGFTRTYAK